MHAYLLVTKIKMALLMYFSIHNSSNKKTVYVNNCGLKTKYLRHITKTIQVTITDITLFLETK